MPNWVSNFAVLWMKLLVIIYSVVSDKRAIGPGTGKTHLANVPAPAVAKILSAKKFLDAIYP